MGAKETPTEAQMTAAKNLGAGREQPKAKIMADRKEMFKRLLVRRLVLCAIVALVALVVWKVKYSKTAEPTKGPVQSERIHMPMNYASFLNDEKIILPFSGEVYVGLRLAKAYPSGSSICFRFDTYLRVKEEKNIGEFVVSAVPRIVGDQVELGEWAFGSFDVDDVSAEQAHSYNTTGDAVFALFKHKVRANPIPIFNKATKILQMTSAEMVVQ